MVPRVASEACPRLAGDYLHDCFFCQSGFGLWFRLTPCHKQQVIGGIPVVCVPPRHKLARAALPRGYERTFGWD